MLLQQLLNGIALGGVYALITIGYSMVYSILQLMNFAHGDIYMVGSMLVAWLLVDVGAPPLPSLALGVIVGAVTAIVVERVAYKPLRFEDRSISMITAVGAALILRNIAEYLWEPRTHAFPSLLGTGVIRFLGLRVTTGHLGVLAITLAVLVGLNLLLRYSKMGQAIIFVAQDVSTSALMGIPVDKTIRIVYALGGGLGVVAGILFGSIYNAVYPWMGFTGTMKAFTAAVIGGIGNLTGAMAGGFILGIIEALASGYISSAYRDAISFFLLIVVLLLKPSGLFGSRAAAQERV
jgi:branched-chain amino acid transport system permease protein